MAYQGSNNTLKPDGAPYDLYREQLQHNASSYSGVDSDDFRFNALIEGLPTRTSHVHDNTAYSSGSVRTDSWNQHLRGSGQKNDTNSNI